MIKIHAGMDRAYLEYLDTQLKKESDISIKNGFMKSYKILRAQDDDGGWNMLILREYESFASLEKNEEKANEVLRKETDIDDQKGMQDYMDRSKDRDVMGTKFMRVPRNKRLSPATKSGGLEISRREVHAESRRLP